MADPVTATFAAVAAVSSLAGGVAQSSALKSQAKQDEYNARNMQVQGKQASANRREELNQSFAAIDAIRAGRNVGTGSPTDWAIRNSFRKRSYEAEDAEQLGIRVGVVNQLNAAADKKRAAPYAMLAGISDAAFRGYSLAR